MLIKNRVSFVVLFAAVAVGAALISKASVLSGRMCITACFRTATLTDATGIPSYTPVEGVTECEAAKDAVANNDYIYLKAITNTTAIPIGGSCCGYDYFCCLELSDFIDPSVSVPVFNLGDGVERKYRLRNQSSINIICHN